MVRDYSSWMWSAYNYWCSVAYEKNCKKNKWIDSRHHTRTPELFHDFVTQSLPISTEELRNRSTSPISPSVPLLSVIFGQQTCSHAETAFTSYLRALWSYIPPENTLVIASEMLNERPRHVALTLQRRLGLDATHLDIKHFDSFRYNTNTLAGVHQQESVFKYQTGLYKASGHRPMLRETEQALGACWCEDCRWISLLTQYPYRCCGESEREEAVPGNKERNETAQTEALERRTLSAIAHNHRSKKKHNRNKNSNNNNRIDSNNSSSNINNNNNSSGNSIESKNGESTAEEEVSLDRFRDILSLPNTFSLFVRRYFSHHTPAALTTPFLHREPSHCVMRPEGMDFIPSDFLSLSVREQAALSPHNLATHNKTVQQHWRERQLSVFRAVLSHNESHTSQAREHIIQTFSFDERGSDHTHASAINANNTNKLRFASTTLIVSSSLRDLVYVEHVLRYSLTNTNISHSTHSTQRNRRRQRFIPLAYLSALYERDEREREKRAQRGNDSSARESLPLVVDVCKSTHAHTLSADTKGVDLFLFLSPSLLSVNAQGALTLRDDVRVRLTCSALWHHTTRAHDNSWSLAVDRVVLLEQNPLAALWHTRVENEKSRDDPWGVAANKERFSEREMARWTDFVLRSLQSTTDIGLNTSQNYSSASNLAVIKSIDSLARPLSRFTISLTQFLSQLSEDTLRVFSSSQLNHVALRNTILPKKTTFRNNYSKSSSLFFFSPLMLPPLLPSLHQTDTHTLTHTLSKRSLYLQQRAQRVSQINNNALDDAELALVRDLLSFFSVSPFTTGGKERHTHTQSDRESVVWASIRAISCVRESFFRERIHRGRYRVLPFSAWQFIDESEQEQERIQQAVSEAMAKTNQISPQGGKDDEQKESERDDDDDDDDDENNESRARKQSFSQSSHTLATAAESESDLSLFINPFLQHDLRFVDVNFYCSLTHALYSLSHIRTQTQAQSQNMTAPLSEGAFQIMSFLTASFSLDHLRSRHTHDKPSDDHDDESQDEREEEESEEEHGGKGVGVHLNRTTSPEIKGIAVDRTQFFHRCASLLSNASAANFSQTILEIERNANVFPTSSMSPPRGVFSLTETLLSDALSALADNSPDEERGQCSAMFETKSFYRTLASLPVMRENASTSSSTPSEKVLMALISRDKVESEQVRVLLEHSTGYYAAVHDVATDTLAFSSTMPRVVLETMPKCTQSPDRKVRMRERNALRAFLVQIDSRRVRANLKILPSLSANLRRRLDQASLQDTAWKTEMIAPAPITRHRSEVDGHFISSSMQPQLACNPTLQPRANFKTRVPLQRALVMLPDPFFAFWKKIFAHILTPLREKTHKEEVVFTRAQHQVSRRIFSEVATAISVLSPLQMPIVNGRIPGPFGDRPVPAFPHESALIFSYESVVGSLFRLKNESNYGNASLPSLRTRGYARLLRFIEKDVDIDWESRFRFSQNKNISILAQSTRNLSDKEISERGKCVFPMLAKSTSSASNKLRALSIDLEKMRSFYLLNPMSLCIVHRSLSDKFPLVHEQLVLLYDYAELSSFCR